MGKEYSFKIANPSDSLEIGECRINHIHELHKMANISYWLRAGFEVRGIASRATRLLARFGFSELKLNRLEMFMSLKNIASQRVAKKAGAERRTAPKPD